MIYFEHCLREAGIQSLAHGVRASLHEARPRFRERSVDLLHIDGCHTYVAVRHDYETWQDVVTDDGVILFHDIAHRGDGFGVYRLWEELEPQFATMSFAHSHGLGVLFRSATHADLHSLTAEWRHTTHADVRGLHGLANGVRCERREPSLLDDHRYRRRALGGRAAGDVALAVVPRRLDDSCGASERGRHVIEAVVRN